MNTWFRFYDSALDDPKVQLLSLELYKAWTSCLCLASRNNGFLPSIEAVSFSFRMSLERTKETLELLCKAGLLDEKRGLLTPHNWHKRQYKSDVSTHRVKQFRKRERNVSETPDETDQRQIQSRAETDTEQNREERETENLAYGEHGHALLSAIEFERLGEKLNSHREDFIRQFDRWVHEAPNAKHNGVRRKDRDPYASICSWFDRAVKEGKVKTSAMPSRPSEEEIQRAMELQFGGRKRVQ